MTKRRSPSSTGTDAGPGSSTSSPLQKVKAGKHNGHVKWSDIKQVDLVRLIEMVTDSGALISFSRTSDGGAVCIFLKDGVDEERLYAAAPEELQEKLVLLVGAYT